MTNTQTIKKMLIEQFGKSRILSVTHGKGTARHWIKVQAIIPTSGDVKQDNNLSRSLENKIETMIVQNSGLELSWFPDEMTSEMHPCIAVHVRVL